MSLSLWKPARKGGREGENGRDIWQIFLLPMVPCASSPVTRVSRSPLWEKQGARGCGGGRLAHPSLEASCFQGDLPQEDGGFVRGNSYWQQWLTVIEPCRKKNWFKIWKSVHHVYKFLFFKVNARTELAIRYNDISPLENHHCAVAFDIISQVKN